ncbi:MAG: putative exosortase interaction protein [Verrucomicrobiales bacterium]|nr:putative exosortase interaction protein [Verrucomicrobiales bacterium]
MEIHFLFFHICALSVVFSPWAQVRNAKSDSPPVTLPLKAGERRRVPLKNGFGRHLVLERIEPPAISPFHSARPSNPIHPQVSAARRAVLSSAAKKERRILSLTGIYYPGGQTLLKWNMPSLDGINSGVVMTTGKADIWNYGDFDRDDDNIYGLDQESREFIWNAPGDAKLLDRAAGTSSYDAAVLEFDVFCTHGQLEMEYQFGSEEYLEYVGGFNDAFMVTVDDVPVSLLPDASGIVAVNTVNGNQNQHLFRLDDLEIEDAVLPANQSVQVEYDGMTVRLRIHAFVTAGQNHHVRIVIADVNDARLDSALFIKEGSVRTVPVVP